MTNSHRDTCHCQATMCGCKQSTQTVPVVLVKVLRPQSERIAVVCQDCADGKHTAFMTKLFDIIYMLSDGFIDDVTLEAESADDARQTLMAEICEPVTVVAITEEPNDIAQ